MENNNSGISLYDGKTELVKLLFSRKIDVNACQQDGQTPLCTACINGHTDIVRLLLEFNADINICNTDGASPLYVACSEGNTDVVKLLLSRNPKVNTGCHDGYLPLHAASREGHSAVVSELLKKRANINSVTRYGRSPLYFASFRGHIETVRLLLQNNADVNICEKHGASPLHVACQEGKTYVVKLLLSRKADVNACRQDGLSPLNIACFKGHTDIVRLLLENEADPNICTKSGDSPLNVACQEGKTDVVKLLLSKKADVNACRHDAWQPLHISSRNGHVDIVNMLLFYESNIDACTSEGQTALMLAAKHGHFEVVSELLQWGANTQLKDKDDKTALAFAEQEKHESIVKILNVSKVEALILEFDNCDDGSRSQCLNTSKTPVDQLQSSAKESSYVGDINPRDLKMIKVIAAGSYGVVMKQEWKRKVVAVKQFRMWDKSVLRELQQLSRASHPNIVALFGYSVDGATCLVMEFAEEGALDRVLHGASKRIEYTLKEAIDWCLQCAVGVLYLHTMKPSALIHRDLKPSNLLLFNKRTRLKICDFGLARHSSDDMTAAIGTGRYMAPEVYTGIYDEKCDVFSWAIILWEVLARKTPLKHRKATDTLRKAMKKGERPAPITYLPKPFETMMKRCWCQDPKLRLCMAKIVKEMSKAEKFFISPDELLRKVETYDENTKGMTTSPTLNVACQSIGSEVSSTSEIEEMSTRTQSSEWENNNEHALRIDRLQDIAPQQMNPCSSTVHIHVNKPVNFLGYGVMNIVNNDDRKDDVEDDISC